MKKLFLPFLLCFSFYCFGQLPSNFDFETHTNPDSKNELSTYFKNIIPKKLLKEVKSASKTGNIILSFNFNEEHEVFNLKTNSFNSELNKLIISGFQNYPIKNLKLSEINSLNNYTLQIISKSKNKNILNCSSKVIIDSQPICNNCNDLKNYFDIKDSFLKEVEKHFYANFNFALIKNIDLKKDNHFVINFRVQKNKNLVVKKEPKNNSQNWSNLFKNELNRVLSTFPNDFESGMINAKKRNSDFSFSFFTKKDEIPKLKDPNFQFNKYSQPNKNSEISNFFSSNISNEILEKSNLNRIHDKFFIYFDLDLNNNPINISTNSRSKNLEKSIVDIFNKFPIEKLPIQNKNLLSSYTFQILSYENNKTIVNCSSSISFQRVPIYNGCENATSKLDAKNCLNKQLQMHVAKKFNTNKDNIDYSNLSGKIKIYCQFKFTKTGGVSIVNIRAPNASIKLEAYRVINSIPKLKMPGIQNGKPVNVTYMLPISFNIEKPKAKKPQYGSN